jgi:hypothetical protein
LREEDEGRRRHGYAIYAKEAALLSLSGEGREPVEAAPYGGFSRHGKTRAAPTTKLLNDVVRKPHTSSLEAHSWRYPLAFLPFPRRHPRMMPVTSLPASSVSARASPLGKALSGTDACGMVNVNHHPVGNPKRKV